MAQTHNVGHAEEHSTDNALAFAQSAARCGYSIHGGLPRIPVFGPEGLGTMVDAPSSADKVPHFNGVSVAQLDVIVRSLMTTASGAVSAADLKEGKAQAVVDSVFSGSYKPKRNTNLDCVEQELLYRIEELIRSMPAMQGKGEDYIENTAKAIIAGIEEHHKKHAPRVAEIRAQILADRVYHPSRKNKKTAVAKEEVSAF